MEGIPIGKNVQVDVTDNTLTVTVDLTKNYGKSKSTGKTDIVATTGGGVMIPGDDLVDTLFINLNIYKK